MQYVNKNIISCSCRIKKEAAEVFADTYKEQNVSTGIKLSEPLTDKSRTVVPMFLAMASEKSLWQSLDDGKRKIAKVIDRTKGY